MTLDERLQLARDVRRSGANCSRSVALAFPDYAGSLTSECLGRLVDALGGGVGGCGLTCGAVTGMAVADGLARPADLTKAQIYKRAAAMVGEFEARNGSTECRELKGALKRDCLGLVLDAVTILHNALAADEA